jgi:hypothetical protein
VVSRTCTLFSAYSDQNQTLARLDTMIDLRWQVVDSNHCWHTPTDLQSVWGRVFVLPVPALRKCNPAISFTLPNLLGAQSF